MPKRNLTIDSTPNPQMITLIMAGLRAILLLAGMAGLMTAEYTDAQLLPLAGALSVLIGGSWELFEQWRQSRIRHSSVVAAARGAAAVQHVDYQPVAVPLKMVRPKS